MPKNTKLKTIFKRQTFVKKPRKIDIAATEKFYKKS